MKKRSCSYLLFVFLVNSILVCAQPAGFSHLRELTIQESQIPDGADLVNFPVLIQFTDLSMRSTSNGGHVNSANGFDIVFYQNICGTLLDHQLDHYDPVTGELSVWVRMPLLSTTANTRLFMYYGNSSVTSSTSVTSVWNTTYSAVWHFGDDPSGVAPQIRDRTGNGHHGTANGAMTPANLQTGKIGRALNFDEVDDYISVPDFLYGQELTISFWFNLTEVNGSSYQYIFSHGPWAAQNSLNIYVGEDNITIPAEIPNRNMVKTVFRDNNDANNFDILDAGTTHTDGNWHYYTVRIQDFGGATVYIDGIATANYSIWGANSFDPVTNLFWGGREDLNAGRFFGGTVDEGRVSTVWRSSNWIRTEFNNQQDPASFFTLGTETSSAGLCFALASGWTNFTATRKNSTVQLDWRIENEKDRYLFVIERSENGTSWLKIAEIYDRRSYSEINLREQPTYYRIRYRDDNKEMVSDVRQVNGLDQGGSVLIYPNPNVDRKLQFSFGEGGAPRKIQLLNAAGSWVQEIRIRQHSNQVYCIEVDPGVPNGLYFLHFQFNDRSITRQLLLR